MSPDRFYFADTSFWVGLLIPGDQYHRRSFDWAQYLRKNSLNVVTTTPVFWEVLNGLSGQRDRRAAAQFYRRCLADPLIDVEWPSQGSHDAALQFYE